MLKYIFLFLAVIGFWAATPLGYAQAQDVVFSEYKVPENRKDRKFLSHKAFKAAPYTPGDISRFMFDDWSGKPIPVWAYVPTGVDVTQAPILFMMHGAKRNPARYLLEWAPHAEERGFIVVAPEFSRKDYYGSRRYNQGNVWRKVDDTYEPRQEKDWSFSAIEPLFDHTVAALDSQQKSYTIYGHSAGSQFVHRFLYYKPEARVKRYLAANAGWYTLPDMDTSWPYGLKDSLVSEDDLKGSLGKNVIVLLGDKDIDMTSKSLRKTPEALAQGEHRYNRGVNFMRVAREQAKVLGVTTRWSAKTVEGVGHYNSGMAAAAAQFVY